ncbi:MAG: hypothetical protein BWK78_07620 [Thiotrichaceae bacterium IS1]|nr:MAG: hypothetical protein BWK78_07620 [Thiotrichaceae bacterium IS1]
MKKILCLIICLAFGNSTGSMSEERKSIDFQQYVKDITKEVTDLTDDGILLKSKKFRYLFNQIHWYTREALEALSSPTFSNTDKHVVVFAIQGLELEDLLSFAEQLQKLLENGKVSSRIFRETLFPPYNWNTLLAEHFENQEVRQRLIAIRESTAVAPEVKQDINQLLSGQALEDIKEAREDEMLPKRSYAEYLKTK